MSHSRCDSKGSQTGRDILGLRPLHQKWKIINRLLYGIVLTELFRKLEVRYKWPQRKESSRGPSEPLCGGHTESSALDPRVLALLSTTSQLITPCYATAMLAIHCCLLTQMISTSPTWELGTKAGALPPWDTFGSWLCGLLKVRTQVPDLFCCSNAKHLQTWRLST